MANISTDPLEPPVRGNLNAPHARGSWLDDEPGWVEGVALESLEAGTVLEVNTQHHCYRLCVVDGPEHRALVTGGALFPESTEVRIAGASAHGRALKVGWIGVGLRLEMSTSRRYITTSSVRSIVIEEPGTVAALPSAS